MGKDSPKFYRLIYRIIWAVSPKYTLHGTENLPDESCVLVGNHCQMYGPIASELYLERPHYIWCAGLRLPGFLVHEAQSGPLVL